MSEEPDRKKSLEVSKSGLPSNEDIVDELVKNIGDIALEHNYSRPSGSKDTEQSTSKVTGESDTPPEEKGTGDGSDDAVESEEEILPEDYIDELHLKDLEVNYSEEDKKRLREDAEQLKVRGNEQFKAGEYTDAAGSYTEALRICPLAFSQYRAVLYANRGAAKMSLNENESAIKDCTKAVELDPQYLKVFLRRAKLYETTEKLDEALADYNKILEIDPLHREALFASKRLTESINERNEKLKTEMLGKLKSLGNMFLRPFGLSTSNFQMVQDPNTGGYSVNFSQNANPS